MKKSIALFSVSIERLKTEKYYNFWNKYELFLLFALSVRIKMIKIKIKRSIN